MIFRLITSLKLHRAREGQLPGRIRSAAEFQEVLRRERLRSSRMQTTFSVLILWFSSRQVFDLPRVQHILNGRLRATDEIGMLAKQQIAILLPDTGSDGGQTVAQSLTDLLEPEGLSRIELLVHEGSGGIADAVVGPALEPAEDQHREVAAHQNTGLMLDPTLAVSRCLVAAPQSADQLFSRPTPTWKRVLDVVLAGTGLILLAPLVIVVALLVKLTSPGPVLFTQWRTGRGGRPFLMYKFRSMVHDAELQKENLRWLDEQDGPAFKILDDPRTTQIGRILRKTCIDELPQLWNVLKGDMSLVGPRPLPCDEADECQTWQRQRLDVLPGMTCIWQVRGRDLISFNDWMRMDMNYVATRSLITDLRILLGTVRVILGSRRNTNHEQSASSGRHSGVIVRS